MVKSTIERDYIVLIKEYLKGDGLFDFIANIPYIIYAIVNGIPHEVETIDEEKSRWVLNVVMGLKIFRLTHYDEVTDAFSKLMDSLTEVFWRKTFVFENLLKWLLTGINFTLAVHYFACGWMLIHRYKLE